MKQRIITGLIGLAALALIIWIGKWGLFATLFFVNGASLYEYLRVSSDKNDVIDYGYTIILGSCMLVLSVFADVAKELIFYALISGILLIFVKDIVRKKHDTGKTIYSVWGFIYISFFLALASHTLFSDFGWYVAIMIILACIACDTFAYFIGIKFGKHKISPEISPKKSIEGSIAGFIASVILCAVAGVVYHAYIATDIPMFVFLASGVVIGIFDQFGDLAASMIKRKFDVKDYGSALPGHGGFLDRIDGMLFSFAAMFVFLNLYVMLV